MQAALDKARNWALSNGTATAPPRRSIVAVRTAVLAADQPGQSPSLGGGWVGSLALHGLIVLALVIVGLNHKPAPFDGEGMMVEVVVLPIPGPPLEPRPVAGDPVPAPAPVPGPPTAAEATPAEVQPQPKEPPLIVEEAPAVAATNEPAPLPMIRPSRPVFAQPQEVEVVTTLITTQTAQVASTDPSANTTAPPRDAAGRLAAGQGQQTYLGEIARRLEAVKNYPINARIKQHEGQGLLQLIIRADGALDAWQLLEPTGSSLLDRAITAMVRDAQPFPARTADNASAAPITITVPINFSLTD